MRTRRTAGNERHLLSIIYTSSAYRRDPNFADLRGNFESREEFLELIDLKDE